jgi:hypothetical protein
MGAILSCQDPPTTDWCNLGFEVMSRRDVLTSPSNAWLGAEAMSNISTGQDNVFHGAEAMSNVSTYQTILRHGISTPVSAGSVDVPL